MSCRLLSFCCAKCYCEWIYCVRLFSFFGPPRSAMNRWACCQSSEWQLVERIGTKTYYCKQCENGRERNVTWCKRWLITSVYCFCAIRLCWKSVPIPQIYSRSVKFPKGSQHHKRKRLGFWCARPAPIRCTVGRLEGSVWHSALHPKQPRMWVKSVSMYSTERSYGEHLIAWPSFMKYQCSTWPPITQAWRVIDMSKPH